MNANHFPNDPGGVFCAFHVPGFGLTWAGANPFGEGFCFGSETGQLLFTDAAGQHTSLIENASASREAVNGIAFSQKWLAATTRKDINFIGPFLPRAHQPPAVVAFVGGGRDVTVAPTSGHFVIPLGPDGIMFAKPGTGEKDLLTISRSANSEMNFSRALALPGQGGDDVIVCAGRRGGLGYADYREGTCGHMLHTVIFNGLDLVDVCSVATPANPLAVVAAAKDGTLVFFNDILTDKAPKTIKFKGIKGTVYRVLSAQGDIYVLTSKGLFGLFRLVATLLQGNRVNHVTTDVLRLPIEAADANLVGSKWLLAAGIDDVLRFDLEKIPKSSESGTSAGEEPEHVMAQPRWEESHLEQKSECMIGAAEPIYLDDADHHQLPARTALNFLEPGRMLLKGHRDGATFRASNFPPPNRHCIAAAIRVTLPFARNPFSKRSPPMRTLVSRSFLFGLLLGWAMTHASVFGQDAGKPAEAKPTAVDKIREGLDKKVTINFAGQSLAEVLNQFRDKTGLPINLDPGLAMSPAPPGNQFGGPVGDPITIKGKDEKASDILRRTLNAHQLCYVILGDAIVVTNPDNAIVQQMRQRVSVNVEGVKLREAAKDLAKKHGVNLIIDPRVPGGRAVSLQIDNTSLETAFRLLAEMAESKAVRMGNVVFVTTEEHAKKIRAEEKHQLENPLNPNVPPAIGAPVVNFGFGNVAGGLMPVPPPPPGPPAFMPPQAQGWSPPGPPAPRATPYAPSAEPIDPPVKRTAPPTPPNIEPIKKGPKAPDELPPPPPPPSAQPPAPSAPPPPPIRP